MFSVILYYAIQGINYLFFSTQDASVLKDKLINDNFISENLSIQDAISTDLLLVSWDLNNRSPRFFTKWSQKNLVEPDNNHNMSLGEMTWASADTPYYFRPAVIKGNTYISGDNVALSPAMFAYFYANQHMNISDSRIRVVSVGATNEVAEKIDVKASLLEWAQRLTSLTAPVKKHTQDYMLQQILKMNNHEFYKFEYDTTRSFELSFYLYDKRLPKLIDLSADMIYTNSDEISQLLSSVISERFGDKYSCTKA